MKRTEFFKKIGIGVVVTTLVPKLIAEEVTPMPKPPIDQIPLDPQKMSCFASDWCGFGIFGDSEPMPKVKYKRKSKRKRLKGKRKH